MSNECGGEESDWGLVRDEERTKQAGGCWRKQPWTRRGIYSNSELSHYGLMEFHGNLSEREADMDGREACR